MLTRFALLTLKSAAGASPLRHPVHKLADMKPPHSVRKQNKPLAPELASGLQLYKMGLLQEAEQAFQTFLHKHPAHADALHFCGLAVHAQGRHLEAARLIERAIARDAGRATFHLNLALCLAALGQQAALHHLRIAVQIQPDSVDAWFNLGVLYSRDQDHAAAIVSYRKVLALAPDHPTALNNLGELLARMGQHDEAARLLGHALKLSPDFTDAQYNLAHLILDEQAAKASQLLGQVIKARPQWVDAYRLYAKAQAKNGDHAAALDTLMQALEIAPADPNLHNDLGLIQLEMGNLSASQQSFESALALEPGHVHALYNLAFSVKAEENPALLEKLHAAIAHAGDSSSELRAMLHFAAGHLHEAGHDYDAAFGEFEQANRLKGAVYDASQVEAHFAAIKAVFTPELFARYDCKYEETPAVFIVGMPRSGTTLTEQIVASHPQAAGAGELLLFNQMANGLGTLLNSGESYPACVPQLTCEVIDQLAKDYTQELIRRGGDAVKISDKMPGNFVHLGLIALILPHAKIIHCRRDPVDTCVSCFTANFTGYLPYVYDLTHLGHYYRCYQDLMAHWAHVILNPIHTLEYEHLIADPDREIRSLLAFIGLPWNVQCLTPHRTRRAVVTASNVQVRQPIYSHAVNRSARYTHYLDPLRHALAGPS